VAPLAAFRRVVMSPPRSWLASGLHGDPLGAHRRAGLDEPAEPVDVLLDGAGAVGRVEPHDGGRGGHQHEPDQGDEAEDEQARGDAQPGWSPCAVSPRLLRGFASHDLSLASQSRVLPGSA